MGFIDNLFSGKREKNSGKHLSSYKVMLPSISGSGKTSFAKALSFVKLPNEVTIRYDQQDILINLPDEATQITFEGNIIISRSDLSGKGALGISIPIYDMPGWVFDYILEPDTKKHDNQGTGNNEVNSVRTQLREPDGLIIMLDIAYELFQNRDMGRLSEKYSKLAMHLALLASPTVKKGQKINIPVAFCITKIDGQDYEINKLIEDIEKKLDQYPNKREKRKHLLKEDKELLHKVYELYKYWYEDNLKLGEWGVDPMIQLTEPDVTIEFVDHWLQERLKEHKDIVVNKAMLEMFEEKSSEDLKGILADRMPGFVSVIEQYYITKKTEFFAISSLGRSRKIDVGGTPINLDKIVDFLIRHFS